MTADELAAELGITGKALRGWFRRKYPRPAIEKHTQWEITSKLEAAARAHYGAGPRRAESRSNMIVTTVALPRKQHDLLSRAAKQRGTVLTELMRQAVAEWLERNK